MGGKRLRNSARYKDFTDTEIEILSRNPNVKVLQPNRLTMQTILKYIFFPNTLLGNLHFKYSLKRDLIKK